MGFGPKDWDFLRICPPIHRAHGVQKSVTAAAQRILGLSNGLWGLNNSRDDLQIFPTCQP